MSTDKELLEMAAKAAGIELNPFEIKNVKFQGDDKFIGFMTDASQWPRGWFNPLTNDGDALRLAVKLRLEVYIHENDTRCISGNLDEATENHNGDPYAATRRAVVRAAAAIGKEIKP